MYPQVEKLGKPLDSIFSIIDDDAEKEKSVDLAARMVALIEIQKKLPPAKRNVLVNLDDLQKRVDELKADPIIQDLGKKLREDPNIGEYVELMARKAKEAQNAQPGAEPEAKQVQ